MSLGWRRRRRDRGGRRRAERPTELRATGWGTELEAVEAEGEVAAETEGGGGG